MTFIDDLLHLFGLQRASQVTPQTVSLDTREEGRTVRPQSEKERILEASLNEQGIASAKHVAALSSYAIAVLGWQTKLLQSITDDITNEAVTPDTLRRFDLYKKFDPLAAKEGSPLSPEIEQALKDALERRGKEEEEEEGKE